MRVLTPVRAALEPRDWFVEIVKPPPLTDDELRARAIEQLKERSQ